MDQINQAIARILMSCEAENADTLLISELMQILLTDQQFAWFSKLYYGEFSNMFPATAMELYNSLADQGVDTDYMECLYSLFAESTDMMD